MEDPFDHVEPIGLILKQVVSFSNIQWIFLNYVPILTMDLNKSLKRKFSAQSQSIIFIKNLINDQKLNQYFLFNQKNNLIKKLKNNQIFLHIKSIYISKGKNCKKTSI